MYTPSPTPQSLDELLRYLAGELARISDALRVLEVEGVAYTVRHTPPDKPRRGQTYYADGVNWSPNGQGEGVYVYTSSGYQKL